MTNEAALIAFVNLSMLAATPFVVPMIVARIRAEATPKTIVIVIVPALTTSATALTAGLATVGGADVSPIASVVLLTFGPAVSTWIYKALRCFDAIDSTLKGKR